MTAPDYADPADLFLGAGLATAVATAAPTQVPEPASLDDLADRWALFRYARDKEAEWKRVKDDTAADIKEALGEAETGLIDGTPVVRFYSRTTHRFDQKALKADDPDLHARYYNEITERRFEVIE